MKGNAAACLAIVAWGWAASAEALGLERALADAQRSNPMLVARRAMADAAGARVAPAGAWSPPMVEVGLVNVPQNGRFDEDPMTMKMVGLAQRVPVFGGNRLSRQAASQTLAAERAGVEAMRFQVLGETYQRYMEAFYALDRARQGELHRTVMDRMVRAARVRYEAGNGRLDEMLRAEAERARAAGDRAGFEARLHAARLRLAATLGESVTSDSLEAPPPVRDPGLEAWLAAVDRSHPRLLEIESRAASFRTEARAARRMVWPDLELRGGYGFRERLADGTAQDGMFSVSVGFMAPVFAGSRELSEAAQMDAMGRSADAELRGAELELRAEIRAAWANAEAARHTVSLLADTVLVARRKSVDATWASYAAGSADLWRVLESSHAFYAEELGLVAAREEWARAQARLVALTGRVDLIGVNLPNPRREP